MKPTHVTKAHALNVLIRLHGADAFSPGEWIEVSGRVLANAEKGLPASQGIADLIARFDLSTFDRAAVARILDGAAAYDPARARPSPPAAAESTTESSPTEKT